ncbi:MAG: hydrogenase 3 maturation endopeptidase HyCI [Candidatus Thorarchaeota archaeon]|jgi:hydrogenase 3 maturation protease
MVRTIANPELAGDVTGLDISEELQNFISDAKRIAILGIGNDLRTDDGVGLFIIGGLKTTSPDLLIENVGSVPEAFGRPLAEFGAERVIMIDAADMRKPAGHVELVTKTRIGGIALSTHSMPLSFLMQYLEDTTGGQTILLGLQPQSIEFGEGLTPEIKEIAQKVISTLDAILESHFRG